MDVMQKAIRVGKIATGESPAPKTQRHKGGKARALALSAKKRSAIAKKAAKARWGKR